MTDDIILNYPPGSDGGFFDFTTLLRTLNVNYYSEQQTDCDSHVKESFGIASS